ncbi:MAG: TIGR04282 family arsenosugar biosynthesis glycosyltransferase [Candidatus Binatus sp.]|uniref:TIGR04282 family arsenosugar biosynthesis glycosyltransferase n=1 Tax=Candidatus Binatus sp. TaxID=2811406 RepID=UPI002726AB0C|nr:TIGR04282 family arsenosugar biosynthesis glycosyltransferase [Candidatus Binatus sp.]MDO8433893.1 TIGR04282 family arsenosugar biosynthesis glycosyltransferase [Candidatus Binatus sp.]
MSARRPTLIVFCREPIPNHAKTRLIGKISANAAAALADAFIHDALAKAIAIKPGRLVIAGSAPEAALRSKYFTNLAKRFGVELIDQGGGSLGMRMARALERYAPDGALLIGADMPSLPARLLKRSFDLLRANRVVIAPSMDGGYYAVGVRGAIPPIFAGIRWGSGGVLAETIARLENARVDFALGPAWYDIDRWSDVMLLGAHLRLMPRSSRLPCPQTVSVLKRLGVLRDDRYSTSTRAKRISDR